MLWQTPANRRAGNNQVLEMERLMETTHKAAAKQFYDSPLGRDLPVENTELEKQSKLWFKRSR